MNKETILCHVLTPPFYAKVVEWIGVADIHSSQAMLNERAKQILLEAWSNPADVDFALQRAGIDTPEFTREQLELTGDYSLAGHPIVMYNNQAISVNTLPVIKAVDVHKHLSPTVHIHDDEQQVMDAALIHDELEAADEEAHNRMFDNYDADFGFRGNEDVVEDIEHIEVDETDLSLNNDMIGNEEPVEGDYFKDEQGI